MDNGITFLPNDRYLLENEKFRLYYTAAGEEAHNFIVVVEDNFSNSYELELSLIHIYRIACSRCVSPRACSACGWTS